MRKVPTVLALIVLSFACAVQSLYSQSITAIARVAGADIINAGSLFDPMADRIKDLDPSTFSLTFINNTSPKQDVQAVLLIKTSATLDEDRINMPLYTLESLRPFIIPKEGRVFTTHDSRGLDDMQFSTVSNDANIQRLKDKIWDPASGGKLPSGKYDISIVVTVVKVGAQTGNEPPITVAVPPVIVSNPTIANLTMPSENGYLYSTPFPQFQWTSDTRRVRLTVFAKRPDQTSLEDATQASDPYLQVEIERQNYRGMSSFIYPQSAGAMSGIEILKGPRPLEIGKTYVLMLEGIRESFGTTIDPLRTIRSFTINDAHNHALQQSYRAMFSVPEFQATYNQLLNQNLEIDPDNITQNRERISVEQLRAVLNKIRQGKFSIHIEE
jgi:hypothetical protein